MDLAKLSQFQASPNAGRLGRAQFGFQSGPLNSQATTVHQVHGTQVVAATPATPSSTQADGMLSNTPGHTIAIKTADCLPVLFSDRESKLVAAVHAGWRGLTAGILTAAWDQLRAHGCRADSVDVAIGPAISFDHFEVGPEVVAALAATPGIATQDLRKLVKAGKGDRSYVDLKLAACTILARQGIAPEQIRVATQCTLSEPEWPSYRRDGQKSGRIMSWIRLD